MNWFDWVLIGWWSLGTVLSIAMIGKPRTPITPTGALIGLVITVALVLGLLWSRGVL